MNRWVLLEHSVVVDNVSNIHYDFLVEDKNDCLTWKFNDIPKINEGFVSITKSPNHRLIWLSRVKHKLSNNRGLVRRIDKGTYVKISYDLDSMELKLSLNGDLLSGVISITRKYCHLRNSN